MCVNKNFNVHQFIVLIIYCNFALRPKNEKWIAKSIMAKFIKIYPENPNEREIQKVVECLREGGVIIYPTDTVYGLGCDITNSKALERIAHLKGVKLEKANFSFVFADLSHL